MSTANQMTFVAPLTTSNILRRPRSISHSSFSSSRIVVPRLFSSGSRIVVHATAVSNGLLQTEKSETNPDEKLASTNGIENREPPKRHLLRFLKLMFEQWRLLIPAIAAGLVASVCSISQPLLFGRINGLLAMAHTMPISFARDQLFKRSITMGTFYFFEVVCTIVFVSLMSRVIDKTARRLRETLFNEALSNDVGFFDAVGRVEVEKSVTDDIRDVREGLVGNLSRDRGFRACIEIILGMILCFSITGRVGAPIFGILTPIVATITARTGIKTGRIAASLAEMEATVRFYISERIRGLRTVKAFGAERKERRQLTGLLNRMETETMKRGGSKAIGEAVTRSSIYITILTFFMVGGLLITAKTLTFELFTCLTGFIWIFNFCMQGVAYTISDTAKVEKSLANVYSVLDKIREYKRIQRFSIQEANFSLPSIRGDVRFQDVCFYYPSRPESLVLKNINFSIRPGEVVALVGESGGGKSTIAAILSRFYGPSGGRVTVDGYDIQQMSYKEYSRHIAVVDQEPVLFQGTIRENIAYGLPYEQLDDETIIQAAKEANAHDFIMNLSDGYDTVWNPGSNLSGGQKQRIAIARSLVKSPTILILDEATSALDQQSERIVQSAMDRLMKNRTVLIIAHRLSTVRSADMIHFVRNGEIIESGSYDGLLQNTNGHFHELVNASLELA